MCESWWWNWHQYCCHFFHFRLSHSTVWAKWSINNCITLCANICLWNWHQYCYHFFHFRMSHLTVWAICQLTIALHCVCEYLFEKLTPILLSFFSLVECHFRRFGQTVHYQLYKIVCEYLLMKLTQFLNHFFHFRISLSTVWARWFINNYITLCDKLSINNCKKLCVNICLWNWANFVSISECHIRRFGQGGLRHLTHTQRRQPLHHRSHCHKHFSDQFSRKS